MANNWIPVSERLPENAFYKTGCSLSIYHVATKGGVTVGWYDPDCESWYCLYWLITAKFQETDVDLRRKEIPDFVKEPHFVKVPHEEGIVTAWMELPEPFANDTNVGNKKEQNDDI